MRFTSGMFNQLGTRPETAHTWGGPGGGRGGGVDHQWASGKTPGAAHPTPHYRRSQLERNLDPTLRDAFLDARKPYTVSIFSVTIVAVLIPPCRCKRG